MHVKTKYGNAEIVKTHYYDGNKAIQLIDEEDGSPIATLTVNLPEYSSVLLEEEFFVKGWGENYQIIEDCRESGYFIDTGKRVKTGFVTAEVWTLT